MAADSPPAQGGRAVTTWPEMIDVKAEDDPETRKAAFRRRLAAIVNGGEVRPARNDAPVTGTISPASVEKCGHPLTGDRECCHVKGAPAIGYELCPDSINGPVNDVRCWHSFPKNKSHRHSSTWLHGDARYVKAGDWLADPETGEKIEALPWPLDIIGETRRGPFYSRPELDPARRAGARLALRLTVFSFALDNDDYAVLVSNPAEVKITVEWHYHGGSGWSYGRDQAGHNYEMSPEGKVKRIYSMNESREAVAYAGQFGPAKAARKFDIPVDTIRSWKRRRG